MARKDKNVTKYSRVGSYGFRITIPVCVLFLAYVIFHLFVYNNGSSIAEYEVQQGRIASSQVYKGIIIRDETVYYAGRDGTVNYYITNGAKVSSTDTVYSVDESGEISNQISTAAQDASTLTADAKTQVANDLVDFTTSYDAMDFAQASTFKTSLNSELSQTLSAIALNSLGDLIDSVGGSFNRVQAKVPGIVLYYTDGYEALTMDDFVPEDLNGVSYNKVSYESGRSVTKGDVVFKLVTSEDWSVVVAITDDLAEELTDTTSISVTFTKDGYSATADTGIWKKNGGYYLQLSFHTAMIRYANDRYLELELGISTTEGLKSPNSAITAMTFFTGPITDYIAGDDAGTQGLLIQRTDDDGNTYMEFVTPTVYYSTDTDYYIDDEDVSEGDVVVLSDSSSTYRIGKDTDELIGVYNVNKGYAVFKQINILYQNEDYAIVEPKTSYGIALYDHIALDGSAVTEGDFID